ncbi:MAG: hypothetical protein WAU60_06105 [Candidatus Competibacter denitrificans]
MSGSLFGVWGRQINGADGTPPRRVAYAKSDQELGPWRDWVAVKGKIFVQFWLKPGEQAVVFEVGSEPVESAGSISLNQFVLLRTV